MINKLCNKITNLNAPIVVGLDPMLDYVPEEYHYLDFLIRTDEAVTSIHSNE